MQAHCVTAAITSRVESGSQTIVKSPQRAPVPVSLVGGKRVSKHSNAGASSSIWPLRPPQTFQISRLLPSLFTAARKGHHASPGHPLSAASLRGPSRWGALRWRRRRQARRRGIRWRSQHWHGSHWEAHSGSSCGCGGGRRRWVCGRGLRRCCRRGRCGRIGHCCVAPLDLLRRLLRGSEGQGLHRQRRLAQRHCCRRFVRCAQRRRGRQPGGSNREGDGSVRLGPPRGSQAWPSGSSAGLHSAA